MPGRRRRATGRWTRVLSALALTAGAVVFAAPSAVAYWAVTSVPGGSGAAAAATLPQGPTPTAVAFVGGVTVSWSAVTLSNGVAVGGYIVSRYNASTGLSQTVGTACAGTVTTTSCTETAVPVGTWQYAVTPVVGANWQGQTSAKSASVTVAPDTTPPSGGSVSYPNGYVAFASVGVSFLPGTDPAGINLASGLVERASATYNSGNQTCGTFSAFTTKSTSGTAPASPFIDTTVVSGNCYQYEYLVSDNAGNQATYTSTNLVKVYTTGAGHLANVAMSLSAVGTGTTPVSYTFSFTTATGDWISALTMTLPPGTGGTPVLGAVATVPGSGTLSWAGNQLTYSVPWTYINGGTAVSVQVAGLTNTSTPGYYTAQVSTDGNNSGSGTAPPVDSGTSGTVPIGPGAMANPTWAVSKMGLGATGATYSYSFTTATSATLSSLTISVPQGTSSTPVLAAVTGLPSTGTLSPSGGILTYSFASSVVSSGTAVSLQVSGMTNPSTAGNYTADLATNGTNGGPVLPVDVGASNVLTLSPGTMSKPVWTVSNSVVGSAGVTYGYGFTTGTATGLSLVTMTVPAGTAGSPVLVSESGLPTVGALSLSGTVLSYSFAQTYVSGTVSLQVSGMTNTAAPGSYTAELATDGANGANPVLPVDSGLTSVVALGTGTMVNPAWSVSKTLTNSTAVTYTYGFTTASTATLSSVAVTVPPGTAGTPALSAVSGLPATGTLAMAANLLTYSFAPSVISAGTAVSLQVSGLTNTSTVGYYTATLATMGTISGGAVVPVDTGLTGAVALSSSALSNPTWTASKTVAGASGAAYTYSFTTYSSGYLTSVIMTVPLGTGGTPVLGTVSVAGGSPPGSGTVSLAGNQLTYSFSSVWFNANTAVSVQVTGLTNTSATGTYTSQLATGDAGLPVDTGTTTPVLFGAGGMVNPTWSVSKTLTSSTAVTYAYSFTTASTATLSSLTMSLPAGTAGSPVLSGFSGLPGSGALSLTSTAQSLTYSFPAAVVSAGTAVSLQIGGMTNTSTNGYYTASMVTWTSTGGPVIPVDTGVSGPVSLSPNSMTSPVWTASSTVKGKPGVTYTYTFTPSGSYNVNSVTMTVPPGTAGTPALGAVTGFNQTGTLSLSGTLLTYSFGTGTAWMSPPVSIQVTGMTNTSSTGSYTAELTTNGGNSPPFLPSDTGVTPALSFS